MLFALSFALLMISASCQQWFEAPEFSKSYFFRQDQYLFWAAKRFCDGIPSARMARIESPAEAKWISDNIMQDKWNNAWLGAHADGKAPDTWLDGTPIKWYDWQMDARKYGQPGCNAMALSRQIGYTSQTSNDTKWSIQNCEQNRWEGGSTTLGVLCEVVKK